MYSHVFVSIWYYLHVYMYMYVYIYIYVCINVYTHRSVSVCKCVSIYLCIFVYVVHKLESSDTVRQTADTAAVSVYARIMYMYVYVLCICMYICIYICINVYTRRSVSVYKCISIYLSIFVHVMHKLESSDTVRADCKTQAPPLSLSRSLSPDSLCCGSGSQLT
jgi:hypothetical protein